MNKTDQYPKKRWGMLFLFILAIIVIEIQWLTHAPIARVAEKFYEDQLGQYAWLTIDTIAVVYMIVFVIVCIPASYVIFKYGIRKGIGFGAILLIIGSIIKGVYGYSLLHVFWGQVILAIAQPFIINGVTAFSARWFPEHERGMSVGFATLAQYIGIVIVMILTPLLVVNSTTHVEYGQGVDSMLIVYMVPSIIAGFLILLFLKEHPKNIPFNTTGRSVNFGIGLWHMFKIKDLLLTIFLFTIGLGIFNAISSMVDAIAGELNINDSDGLIGGIMLIGGIVGAIILPVLSDKYQKRKPFLVYCMLGVIPAIIGLTYAPQISLVLGLDPDQIYTLALASSFLLGFCIMSAGPIGFQYAAEITNITSEATSQGVLLLVGQVSGIILVTFMSMQNNAYLNEMMQLFILLSVIAFILVLFIQESPISPVIVKNKN